MNTFKSGAAMSVLVNSIVMLGMLVVVPAGLRLTGAAELDRIRRLWPLFAVPGAVSLRLPRGTTATALAACYALGAVLLAMHAPYRLLRSPSRSTKPAEIALLTALVTPPSRPSRWSPSARGTRSSASGSASSR